MSYTARSHLLLPVLRTVSLRFKPSCSLLEDGLARFCGERSLPFAVHRRFSSASEEAPTDAAHAQTQAAIEDQSIETATEAPQVRVAPLPADIVLDVQETIKADTVKDKVTLPSFVRGDNVKKKAEVCELSEAVQKVKGAASSRFDETIEAHVRLGVDPKRSDQTVRGSASLPHGSGKAVRVAVFAEGDAAAEALASGAEFVGSDDLITMVKESGGKLSFDKCIATPSMMPKLGQVARILGPRGLMPNPKLGSITTKIADAVRAAKRGQVDFRADKQGIVHVGIGKVSFEPAALEENIGAFAAALLASKPVGLKKTNKFSGYFTTFTLSSTHGPGIRVSVPSVAHKAEAFIKQD